MISLRVSFIFKIENFRNKRIKRLLAIDYSALIARCRKRNRKKLNCSLHIMYVTQSYPSLMLEVNKYVCLLYLVSKMLQLICMPWSISISKIIKNSCKTSSFNDLIIMITLWKLSQVLKQSAKQTQFNYSANME